MNDSLGHRVGAVVHPLLRTAAVGAVILLGAAGCGGGAEPVVDCAGSDTLEVVCGFQNPEDLALVPGELGLLVSQFGAMDGHKPGNLAFYDFRSGPRILFSGGDGAGAEPGWGDPACTDAPPAAFAPHGLDLDRRSDGRWQLLVVNHGGRESVEFFELTLDGDQPRLLWKGCVPMGEDLYLNDVVSRSDGGFWATHMYDRSSSWQMVASLAGVAGGYVVGWSPGGGLAALPGSEGVFPNGIEKSEDERFLYVNMYMMSGVVKYDLAAQKIVATADLPSPDNLTWDSDGRHLLVASHSAPLSEMLACQDLSTGSCGFRFEILRLDPADMGVETVLSQAGAPMGAGTVAIPVGDRLYIGTFAGDRIGVYRRTPPGA